MAPVGKMMIHWLSLVNKVISYLTLINLSYLYLFTEGEPTYPKMLIVKSMEKAAEIFPGSLGEYQLLKDEYHNGYPVFQNTADDKRYIIYIGNKSIISNKTFYCCFPLGNYWYITQDINNNAKKEMRSAKKGQVVVPELGWQYFNSDYDHSSFTNCKTVR